MRVLSCDMLGVRKCIIIPGVLLLCVLCYIAMFYINEYTIYTEDFKKGENKAWVTVKYPNDNYKNRENKAWVTVEYPNDNYKNRENKAWVTVEYPNDNYKNRENKAWVTVEYPNENYQIIPNIARPKDVPYNRSSDSEIVICTQTSIDNLHHVMNMSERWEGHISVAVFAYGEEIFNAIQYILLMSKCSNSVKLKTSFHVVYPTTHPPRDLTDAKNLSLNCDMLDTLKDSYGRENYDHALPYPVNVLRNVAIMFSGGTHVFNLDIDFIMSKGMKTDMEGYLNRRSSHERLHKYAYIIPCFESYTSGSVHTKAELLQAVSRGQIRPFAFKRCNICQAHMNYSRWYDLPYPSAMFTTYEVKYQPRYEPFYIADKKMMPMFDGRFKQYGCNRISQVCEAYVSGFKFVVMNNAFVIHDGFKEPGKFYKNKSKDNSINTQIFSTVFMRDLNRKYPDSDIQCALE